MTELPIIENCDNCGVCCLEQESPPGYLMILTLGDEYAHSDDDIDRVRDLPFELLDELETYGRLLSNGEPHPNDGICLWYDESNKRCKHYELRPSVCREELKCGDDVCRRWRDKYGIK